MTSSIKALRSAGLFVLLGMATLLNAQIRGGGWQHLGSAHMDGRADHDKIEVNRGPFNALQMGVTSGATGFDRIVVHFQQGADEVLPVGAVVCSGGRTPSIPMRGGNREIRTIYLGGDDLNAT